MHKPINPYCGLAFYAYDVDISLKGWVYSPLSKFPAFQFNIASETVTSFALVNTETGSVTLQNISLIDTIATTDGNIVVYDGSTLTSPPAYPGGKFRARIITSGGTYYSHQVCMTRFFDTVTAPALSITDCAISGEPGDPYQFEITITGPSYGNVRLSLDETQSGNWQVLNVGTGTYDLLSGTFTTPYGSIAAFLRVEWFYQDVNFPAGHYIRRIYTLSLDGLDPCNTDNLTLNSTLTQYAPEAMRFDWWNSTDLKPLGLYYADGFKNQLYHKFALDSPSPVTDEEYEENGEGDLFLSALTVTHQYNAQFWPCPDYLVLALKTARHHDNKTIATLDPVTTTVVECDFTDVGIDQEHNRQGSLQMRVDKAYIGGCVEEYELVP